MGFLDQAMGGTPTAAPVTRTVSTTGAPSAPAATTGESSLPGMQVGLEGSFHTDATGQLHRVKNGVWRFAGQNDKIAFRLQQSSAPGGLATPAGTPSAAPDKRERSTVPLVVLPNDAPASNPALASAKPVEAGPGEATAQLAGSQPAAPTPGPVETQKPKRVRQKAVSITNGQGAEADNEATMLYVDCVPVGGEVRSLNEYANALGEKICASFQVKLPDIRLANDQQLGYGRWKPLLEALVRSGDIPIPPGHYLVNSSDERQVVIASVIGEKLPAGSVIRALR